MLALPAAALILLPLVLLSGGMAFLAIYRTEHPLFARIRDRAPGALSRRCRYCRFGRATLTEEKSHCESNELVEVRCYVCRSCGLPQWSVHRTPLIARVR